MEQQKALNNLRKALTVKQLPLWGSISSVVFALVFVVMASVNANAQGAAHSIAADIQSMSYDVYAGGFNAVTADLDVSFQENDRYSFKFVARTVGFLASLAPWEGAFETEGWALQGQSAQPELHKSTSVWRSEVEIKEYNYDKNGHFKGLTVTKEGKDRSEEEVNEELTQGTTDALTATLEVMNHVARQGKCEGKSEIFDGKRRFELVFTHEADEVLETTKYNVYEGSTARCTVEVKPLAGSWHKKPRGWLSIQEQGRTKGMMPTVWFASMSEDAPAVPVKVRVKTEFGTLFMHLTEYRNGKVTKIAEKH
jgi:hypothetical protein